jgi:predicted NBD/HSP70 family sugar kinase
METVRLQAPISRAEIARQTSLTPQTISNIVGELIEADLIREAGKRQQGRGAPSITLGINAEGAYSIGLDLDRDHLTGVLIDLSGTVRQRIHHRLSFPTPEEAVALMAESVHDLVDQEDLSLDKVSGAGIGLPGPIEVLSEDREVTTVNPEAFPGWDHSPIVDMLEAHVDLPIILKNNATAATVGERWYGIGKDVSTFFYLLFGIGLGGGVVIDGHPYEGHSGNAGELGYVPTLNDESKQHSFNGTQPTHLGEHYHLPRLYEQLQQSGVNADSPEDLAAPFVEESPPINDWLDTVVDQLAPLLVSVLFSKRSFLVLTAGVLRCGRGRRGSSRNSDKPRWKPTLLRRAWRHSRFIICLPLLHILFLKNSILRCIGGDWRIYKSWALALTTGLFFVSRTEPGRLRSGSIPPQATQAWQASPETLLVAPCR